MNAVPEEHLYTLEEYFALEESSEEKHEYYHGLLYAMSGGTDTHSLIAQNMGALLHAQLRGKPCRTYNSDLRMKIEASGYFTYPDVSVICGPPQYADGRRDQVLNPTVLIEVLSPSTETHDRGFKFQQYRTIPSLHDILLVAKDTRRVEHYQRHGEHAWLLNEYQDDAVVTLSSINCALPLVDIYEGVTFEHA